MAEHWPKWIEEAARRELHDNAGPALQRLATRLRKVGVTSGDISNDGATLEWGPHQQPIGQGGAFQAVFDLLDVIEHDRESKAAETQRAKAIGRAAEERTTKDAETRDALERKLPDV